MKNKNKKKGFRKTHQTFLLVLFVLLGVAICTQSAFAASPTSGATTVTEGINGLIEIVKAFVSSVGAIIVLWGLFEWGNAMQSTDGAMQSQAFKRIGGGIIMTLGPQIFLSLIA